MNRMLAAVSALALVAVAAPAFAQDSASVEINAAVAPQCVVNANGSGTVDIAATDLAGSDGFLATGFVNAIAAGLTDQGIKAWCSGSTNTVVLTRSALVRQGSTGALSNGFATAVIYDVAANIDGAVRSDGTTPLEGTSDGLIGPGSADTGTSVSAFGPTGDGADVSFYAEAGQTPAAVSDVTRTQEGPTSAYATTTANRLLAGTYLGTVTLTLTAGL